MLVHCCRIQALEAKRVSDSPSTGSLVTPHLPALSQGRHDSPAHARHARCTCGHVADLPFGKATVKSFLQPVSNHSLYDPDLLMVARLFRAEMVPDQARYTEAPCQEIPR